MCPVCERKDKTWFGLKRKKKKRVGCQQYIKDEGTTRKPMGAHSMCSLKLAVQNYNQNHNWCFLAGNMTNGKIKNKK